MSPVLIEHAGRRCRHHRAFGRWCGRHGVAEARPERIAAVAYIAGMMLPSDMQFRPCAGEEKAEERGLLGIGPYLEWNEDRSVSTVPPEAAAKIFLNDMPYDVALRRRASNLTPQAEPGRALQDPLDAAALR
jgi:hypothetical protein